MAKDIIDTAARVAELLKDLKVHPCILRHGRRTA